MLHPKARYDFYVVFLFLFLPKVTAYVFKSVPGSIVSSIQFISEVEVLEKSRSLRTDENDFLYFGLAYSWKFFLVLVESFAFFIHLLQKYFN
jgi:hypothetical protein